MKSRSSRSSHTQPGIFQRFSFSRHDQTRFIHLDTHKCQACWECIQACPNGVIGKVDFLRHRHARISNPDQCKGCKKCVKVCRHQAISLVSAAEKTS